MTIAPGSRLGSHEIVGLLGAGGMGEVYRARDTRLNREVAIKVLPALYASDPERIARFHREAQAVAALNHTSIAGIYDLAEAEGVNYLVLELIEGETLAERMRRGPVPVEEALVIAKQILEALEVAHEKGICHRDLKPANVKLTPDGAVKVLDFGLAKFLQAPATAGNLTQSPTLSLAGTIPGLIMGTAGYMAPEQAKGFEADQRSDIFSFGCILYELLTGRQAFEGETVSEILASVLKSEVDWTLLPPRLHPRLVELLRRCLEKNPKKRWHAAADVRNEIESVMGRAVVVEEPAVVAASPRTPVWKRALALTTAALIGAILAGIAVWQLRPDTPRTVSRFVVPLADGQAFSGQARRLIDVSPDGTRIVYLANNCIYVRDIAALDARLILNAQGQSGSTLVSPTFSPDGQSIAFVMGGGTNWQLKRVAVSGGAPVTMSDLASPTFGMRWDEHGILIGLGDKGIGRVADSGGAPEVIVPAGSDEYLASPQLLADGKAVLYTVKKTTELWDKASIVTQRLDGGERKVIIAGGADGRYLPTGHLVYMLNGVLLAVRFNETELSMSGGPVPVVEGMRRGITAGSAGSSHAGIARNGTLVYAPGTVGSETVGNDLAIFDRKGGNEPLKLPLAAYRAPRVSPDGKRVAFETDESNDAVVWVYDLSGGRAIQRLTFSGRNRAPIWSPDGQWLAFQSDREGDWTIFRQRADGSGVAERLTQPEKGVEHVPQDWSPDGVHMLVTIRQEKSFTLGVLSLKTKTITPMPQTTLVTLVNGAFSPDGRWIAYQGRNAANQITVLVEPFPATGAKYLVPFTPAGHPVWSRKGDEIVVNTAPTRSIVVSVTTTPTVGFGPPTDFPRTGRTEPNPAIERRSLDFMPDGRVVGVLTPGLATAGAATAQTNQLVVVLNWFDELKQRVPIEK